MSCFTLKELKQLKVMADSPYFNNQESVRALLEFLLLYAPTFEHPKCNYSNAFKFVFGSRAVQSDPQTAVAKVMTKLMALVKEFIVQEELSRQSVQRSLYQIQFFRRKALVDFIPKLLEDGDQAIEENPYRNEYYFRHKLLLESEWARFLNMMQDKSRPDYNLGKQDRALDAYYALSKLQMYCFAKNEEIRINLDFDYSQLPQFLSWLQSSALLDDITIRLWYQALLLLNNPDPVHFHPLKETIGLAKEQLSPTNSRMLYSYLANTARLIFKERETYFRELFELYKAQIELGVLHVNGYLSPVMMRNITIVGLKRREFDWVQMFLDENTDRIVPTYMEREDIITLCKAYLYFEKKEFNRALEMINSLRYESLFTKMDERRMRLLCYYELRMSGPLDDLINSFRKFLTDHKKKIPPAYLEENRLFIHFMHKLVSVNLKIRENKQALEDEIRQVAILPEKEWLLTKVNEG
ncbi:MAG: hypothetical protein IT262_01600 [Saprospiraceae bacterium]|nr:hypothetical protein [Saprospiraceae bacterium]